jgi:hypothetical protein
MQTLVDFWEIRLDGVRFGGSLLCPCCDSTTGAVADMTTKLAATTICFIAFIVSSWAERAAATTEPPPPRSLLHKMRKGGRVA